MTGAGRRRQDSAGEARSAETAAATREETEAKIPLVRGWIAIVLPLLTTLLLILSFPPLDRGELGWFALVPWLVFLHGRGRRAAVLGSALIGALLAVFSLSWLAILTPVGLYVMIAYQGFYTALGGLLIRRIWRRGRIPAGLGAACVLVAIEWVRSTAFTGFPWLLLGHTQYRFPLFTQVADIGGVLAVSFALALVNASIARAIVDGWDPADGRWRRRRVVPAILPGALCVVFVTTYGAIRLTADDDEVGPVIAGIQANIPMDLKHGQGTDTEILRRHFMLTTDVLASRDDVDLVVWSETMFPGTWDENVPDISGEFQQLIRSFRFGTSFLTGITATGEGESDPSRPGFRHWNRAVLFDEDGAARGMYDKIHLVPGGEFIPMGSLVPFRRRLEQSFFELAGWYPTLQRGTRSPVLRLETGAGAGEVPFGVMICYDSVFADVARLSARQGARFLVNISNDGWYRDSAELDQILAITAFRAVESRLPLFRVTNSGISAVVDSRGRFVERLSGTNADGLESEKAVSGVLVRRVGLGTGSSPYVRFGDVFAWLVVAAGLVFVLVSGGRPAGPGPSP